MAKQKEVKHNEQKKYDVLIVSGSPAPYSVEHLKRLVALSNEMVAVDRGAEYCKEIGVIPDYWVGDGDTTSLETRLWLKDKKVKIKKLPLKKDEVDIVVALLDVVERNPESSVAVVCATGAKIAHELAFLGILKKCYVLNIDIYMPDTIMYVLQGLGRQRAVFTPSKMTTFSVVPLTDGSIISESGCVWELNQEQLPVLAYKGVSNEAKAERPVTVVCHRGTVLLIIEQ